MLSKLFTLPEHFLGHNPGAYGYAEVARSMRVIIFEQIADDTLEISAGLPLQGRDCDTAALFSQHSFVPAILKVVIQKKYCTYVWLYFMGGRYTRHVCCYSSYLPKVRPARFRIYKIAPANSPMTSHKYYSYSYQVCHVCGTRLT